MTKPRGLLSPLWLQDGQPALHASTPSDSGPPMAEVYARRSYKALRCDKQLLCDVRQQYSTELAHAL